MEKFDRGPKPLSILFMPILDFKCLFVGAVYKKCLSLIAGYGTAVYYYDKYSEEAERMIKSARFIWMVQINIRYTLNRNRMMSPSLTI
jgi:hypothetical protein